MVEWWNGGMVEWWNGGMVEWWNGGMTELRKKTQILIARIVEWRKIPRNPRRRNDGNESLEILKDGTMVGEKFGKWKKVRVCETPPDVK